MKIKILISIILFTLFQGNSVAQNKINNFDSLLNISNQSISGIEVKLKLLEEERVKKESEKKEDLEFVVANLKQAAVIVEGMALLLTIFLTWLSVLGFLKFREAKNEVKRINTEVTKKLNDLNRVYETVSILEKQLTGDLVYTKKGLESVFDFLNEYLGSISAKKYLELIFLRDNICKLYSLDENDRFIGISALIYKGNPNCIKECKHPRYHVLLSKYHHLRFVRLIKMESDGQTSSA